jgi:hypothetical protein
MRLRTPFLLLPLAACAPRSDSASGAAPREFTYTATDFAFAGPDSLPPGVTTLRMVNHGTQDHHMILGRVDDGKTLQDVMTYAAEHPGLEPPYITWHGVANGVGPGQSDGATVDLPSGRYVLLCFLPDPTDGKDHMSKGMMKEVVVAGPPETAGPPKSDGEIRLKDYAFEIPAFAAGAHTFKVINDGPGTHEFQIVRLNDGASVQDYLAALAPGAKGPPPGVMVGGPGAFSKGGEGYWSGTFTPGRYAALCFVPAPDGQPHFMKGMVREFTITAS